MRMEGELLDIAKKDLEAAKILYNTGLYPQAVFFFQQSVEKTNKSLGLMLKLVKEDELKNYIRHKPIKIYGRIFRKKLREIEQANKFFRKYPHLRKLIMSEINLENYEKKFRESIKFIDEISRKQEEIVNISSKELEKILELIKKFEKGFEQEIKPIKNKDLLDAKKHISKSLKILSKYAPDYIEKERQNLEKLDEKLMRKINKIFLRSLYELMPAYLSLFYLSIITLHHSEYTRYPQNNKSPRKLYNKKSAIVKYLPTLIEIQEKALMKIKKSNLLSKLKT